MIHSSNEVLTNLIRTFFSLMLIAAGSLTAAVRTVSVTEGTSMAATVAPDQSAIVMDLQGTLWTLPMKGGKAKRITDRLLEPARPDYSPQGGLVAFQAYSGGTFHIWTSKPDGTGLHQLTTGHGDDRDPRISPDGTKITFSSDRAFAGSYDIWVAEIATGKLTPWTSGPADEYEPAWSPDGSEIAFVSGTGANSNTIFAVNATGTIRTLITVPAGPPGGRCRPPGRRRPATPASRCRTRSAGGR